MQYTKIINCVCVGKDKNWVKRRDQITCTEKKSWGTFSVEACLPGKISSRKEGWHLRQWFLTL